MLLIHLGDVLLSGVPFPYSNALFTTKDTYGMRLNTNTFIMIKIQSTLVHYTLLNLLLQINALHKSTLFIYSTVYKVVQGQLVRLKQVVPLSVV